LPMERLQSTTKCQLLGLFGKQGAATRDFLSQILKDWRIGSFGQVLLLCLSPSLRLTYRFCWMNCESSLRHEEGLFPLVYPESVLIKLPVIRASTRIRGSGIYDSHVSWPNTKMPAKRGEIFHMSFQAFGIPGKLGKVGILLMVSLVAVLLFRGTIPAGNQPV